MESVLLSTIIEDLLDAEKNIEKKVNNGINLIESDKIKTYEVTNANLVMELRDALSIKFKKYHIMMSDHKITVQLIPDDLIVQNLNQVEKPSTRSLSRKIPFNLDNFTSELVSDRLKFELILMGNINLSDSLTGNLFSKFFSGEMLITDKALDLLFNKIQTGELLPEINNDKYTSLSIGTSKKENANPKITNTEHIDVSIPFKFFDTF